MSALNGTVEGLKTSKADTSTVTKLQQSLDGRACYQGRQSSHQGQEGGFLMATKKNAAAAQAATEDEAMTTAEAQHSGG